MLKREIALKCLLSVCAIILLISDVEVECRRFGGGSRSSSRPSYSRPSPSHHYSPSPSYHSPASLSYPSYHPAPSRTPTSNHPSSSSGNSRPLGFDHITPVGSTGLSGSHGSATNYGFNTGGSGNRGSNPPGIGFNVPATQSHSNSHPSAPVGPPVQNSQNVHSSIGFKPSVTQGGHSGSNIKPSAPLAEHPTNAKPLGNANAGNSQPIGFKTNNGPIGSPTNVKPVGNVPPGAPYPIAPPPYTPHNPGIAPPAYNPAHNTGYNPAGYGPPPPPYSAYPQQQYHPGGYGYPNQHYAGTPGVTNININNINTNNHHYGGGGGGYGYGGGGGYSGFGYSYPSYSYTSSNLGSGALGFFLGYSLAKVTTPTFYSSPSFYNGYTPRYDHYEVHHYYHNRDSIPKETTIQPNTIIGCVGDSGTICPSGTTSLCTSNGAILCVASATSTVPCTDQKQGNCVKTIIPCVNGTGDCQVGQNKTLTIPCISKAQVTANITYVNNTIIVNNTTIINNNVVNGTLVSSNSTVLASAQNVTTMNTSSTEAPTTLPPSMTSDAGRSKRETPAVPVNEFCVTILALPAERKQTEQEHMYEKATGIFSKFLVKALGVN